MQVCSFPNGRGSKNYYVPLGTLASTKPTLAVLAFRALVPYVSSENPNENPSSVYCTQQLGGTVASKTPTDYLPYPNGNLSWWTEISDMWYDGVSDLCMFADGSSMDSWTLFYHATTNTSSGIPSVGIPPAGIPFAGIPPAGIPTASGIKFAYNP